MSLSRCLSACRAKLGAVVCAVVFAEIAIVVQLSAQQAQPSAVTPLVIAVENAADLWSRPDGTGFANEIVTAAFRAAHVPIRLNVVPYARCKQLVVEGGVVACLSMSHDASVATAVRFPSIPLFVCNTELLENAAHPLSSNKLSALPARTRVGVVLGYEYPLAVDSARRSGRIILESSPSEAILMRKLAAGRVDAALMNLNEIKTLAYVAARDSLDATIVSRGQIGALESYIGFSQRNAQSGAALTAFELGMKTIRASGELAVITRRWADSSRLATRSKSTTGRGA